MNRLSKGKGRIILSAAGANQVAQEDTKLGHGVFTYHLIKALKGAGDKDGDGYVSVDEAYAYVSKAVPKATGYAQTPVRKGSSVGQLYIGRVKANYYPSPGVSPFFISTLFRACPIKICLHLAPERHKRQAGSVKLKSRPDLGFSGMASGFSCREYCVGFSDRRKGPLAPAGGAGAGLKRVRGGGKRWPLTPFGEAHWASFTR
jgi:hypothetical protein